MKKHTLTLFLLFLSLCIYGQSPEKMSYQAVIRDASNTLVTNQSIGMQIHILQTTTTGDAVYTETQTVTTNTNGLVSLEIGMGYTSDDFNAIDWSAGPYFIKTETDPTGGSNYTITGTSQLMSVPFAMYAKSSGNGITTDQSDAIVANTLKVGYTEALVSANTAVVANTAKVGITTQQASDITSNTTKTGITTVQSDAIVANTLKVGYTEALVSANTDVSANTLKVGYTEALVSANTDVAANTAKYSKNEVDALIANLQSKTEARVGDIRAGGVVFWVDPSDNRHGLVVTFSNVVEGPRGWGCYGTNLPNVPDVPHNALNPEGLGAEIGDGFNNTNAILNDCPTAPAALAARSLGAQWFLPSIKELNQMYINKSTLEAIPGFTAFGNHFYWSSSDYSSNSAWGQFLNSGSWTDRNKSYANRVRAVRAF